MSIYFCGSTHIVERSLKELVDDTEVHDQAVALGNHLRTVPSEHEVWTTDNAKEFMAPCTTPAIPG